MLDFSDDGDRMPMTMRATPIQTKFWHADDLGDAELLRGTFLTHNKACLALITRGAICIEMRGSQFVARAGGLYAIDAEEPHAGWPVDAQGWSLRTIYVDISQLESMLGDGDRLGATSPGIAGPIIRDSRLTALFRQVHSSSETGGSPLARGEQYSKFVALLLHCHTCKKRTAGQHGSADREIRMAREFLDAHLDEKVHLSDIAQAVGLPPFRLPRSFERAVGMTPHGYQRQARLVRATSLMRLGHTLGDTAAACGFADQPHLTRSFRATLGITPGAFRRAYRQTLTA